MKPFRRGADTIAREWDELAEWEAWTPHVPRRAALRSQGLVPLSTWCRWQSPRLSIRAALERVRAGSIEAELVGRRSFYAVRVSLETYRSRGLVAAIRESGYNHARASQQPVRAMA